MTHKKGNANWEAVITQNIGQRVKELRKAQGYKSQSELSKRLDDIGYKMDRSTLASLETGRKQNITVSEIIALSVALSCTPTDLIFSPYILNDSLGGLKINSEEILKLAHRDTFRIADLRARISGDYYDMDDPYIESDEIYNGIDMALAILSQIDISGYLNSKRHKKIDTGSNATISKDETMDKLTDKRKILGDIAHIKYLLIFSKYMEKFHSDINITFMQVRLNNCIKDIEEYAKQYFYIDILRVLNEVKNKTYRSPSRSADLNRLQIEIINNFDKYWDPIVTATRAKDKE